MIRNMYARILALMLSVTLAAALPLPVQAETPAAVTAETSASSSGGETKQTSAAKKSKKSKKKAESEAAAASEKETESRETASAKKSLDETKSEETTAAESSGKTKTAEMNAAEKKKETETESSTSSKKKTKAKETTASKKDKKTEETTASKKDKKTKETTASKKDKKTEETTASKKDKKTEETTAPEKDKKTEETTTAPKEPEKETTAEKEAEPSSEGKQTTDAKSDGEQEGGEKAGKEETPASEEGTAEKPAESSAESSGGEQPAESTEGNREETTASREPEVTPSKEETAAEKESSQPAETDKETKAPETEKETTAPETEKETKAEKSEKETKAPEESSAEPEAEPAKKDVNEEKKSSGKSSEEKETTADSKETDLSIEAVSDPETAANEPKAERISESEEAKSRTEPYAEQAIDEITGDLEWIEDEQGNVRLEPAAEDTMGILFQIPLVTTFIEPTFIRDFRFRHVDGIPASLPEGKEIYAAQDARAKVVGKVIRGKALVNIIEKGPEWSFVEAGYVRGFVQTSDLKEEKNLKPDIDLETAVGKGELPGMVEETVNHLDNPAFNYTLTTAMDVAAEKNPALTAMAASIYDSPEAALLDVPEPTEKQKDQLQQLLKSSAKVIGTLKTGDLAYILADLEDGKVVFVESGNVRGFVNVEKLTTGKEAQKQLTGRNPDMLPTAEEVLKWEENRALYYTITSIQEPNDAVRQEVVAFALQFVGNPYVWGGTDLINGTDCSGFVMRVYEHFGYQLPRTSYYQRGAGEEIKTLKDAKLGDLILYNGHVALYIGNGQIVHASNHHAYPVGGIKVSRASVKPIIAIRRIIPD